jgi:hypothetical protein
MVANGAAYVAKPKGIATPAALNVLTKALGLSICS